MSETNPEITAKGVEEWLREVVYTDDPSYIPSDFALEFVNFIKLVNGEGGEENVTPVLHYKMLDQVGSGEQNIANMVFRGAAKTSLFAEYLFLYLGVYGELPGFGLIILALYVSDSIENGVKNMRKNLEFRWENSEFLQEYIPKIRFTDIRWEFTNADGGVFIVKGYGAKALALDTTLFTETGTTTIGACSVGDKIYGADGKLTVITKKSELFHRPMFELLLEDGRTLKVCEDHINSVVHKEDPNNIARYVKKNLLTKELRKMKLQHTRIRKRTGKPDYLSNENLLFVENCKSLDYAEKRFLLEPYTLGLLLGDGSMKQNGSNILHGHVDDIAFYKKHIPYSFGSEYVDTRNSNVISLTIKGISYHVRDLGVTVHGDHKFIPELYFYGSEEQRLRLLQGLMDTDGSIQQNGRMDFCSNSERLVDDVANLARSLGGTVKKRKVGKAFRIEIWSDLNIFRLPRKAKRFTGTRVKNLVAITSIRCIADQPSQCIAVDNDEHQFIANEYFRTHNTGVRGSKERGVRPMLAVLDDLISDEDARSATVISSVEDTVYKAVNYALHPKRFMIIWSGTPFNAKDPLYKAVESGAWKVNVYPICEHYPCSKEDFKGAWPDRFPYEYVKKQYDKAAKIGKIDTFNQELMLQIMSDEDRLIKDSEINWYGRDLLLQSKSSFNFYITTDFATSDKQSADFSVISVWAYNSKGHWFWVDGICKKQTMDKNISDLFRLAQQWDVLEVGIEISGQQGGFIPWIQDQMIVRNNFFNLAKDKDASKPGIRPNTNKMVRFNIVVPWFKANQMFFPRELKETPEMLECLNELQLVSAGGMKSKHDDFLDTISMLANLTPWRPSDEVPMVKDEFDVWELQNTSARNSGLSSYIV